MSDSGAQAKTTISLEAIECSNRCRHCETSYGPRRRHLSRDEVRAWGDRVRGQAERLSVEVEIGLNNPELLDHPEWRELLADLGDESLGRAFATNGRQIARERGLVEELRQRGMEWVQLTLGGASAEAHDAFTRRPGSLDELVCAAEQCHAAGMHVCWVYIGYHPLGEVARMSELAMSISGPYSEGKYDHRGGIDQCIFLVKPQGEGAEMEHLGPSRSDLVELPDGARDLFCCSYGAACETEGELVKALSHTDRQVGCLERGDFGGSSFLVACPDGNVYPYCHERWPAYLLGNLEHEGLQSLLRHG